MTRAKLKEVRGVLGKTQGEMAELLDVSISHYKQLESGDKNPSLDLLKKFKTTFIIFDVEEIFLSV